MMMPSKNTVPAQEVSELSDEVVRLHGEIVEHIERREMLARKLLEAAVKIERLTEQRDHWKVVAHKAQADAEARLRVISDVERTVDG